MKKIISLLVVSMLVLGCFSMTAFAADYGYNLHTFSSGANAMNSDGIIPLYVRAVGTILGGYIEIQYDSTKVIPVVYTESEDEDTGETVVNISEATAATLGKDVVVGVQATKVDNGCSLDLANSKIKANFFSTSALGNNKQLIKIYFKAIDKKTDNWNEKTFVVTDAYVEDSSNIPANFSEASLTKTYANASVSATTDKWEAAANTDMPSAWTAPAALGGEVRRVTVFGKNATSKALAANSYGVTFGDNTYYGIATDTAVQYWAIVIVDTEGNKITSGNTYNGTAFVGTETWSVSVSAD